MTSQEHVRQLCWILMDQYYLGVFALLYVHKTSKQYEFTVSLQLFFYIADSNILRHLRGSIANFFTVNITNATAAETMAAIIVECQPLPPTEQLSHF
jgi:hypothetical protein